MGLELQQAAAAMQQAVRSKRPSLFDLMLIAYR